MRLSFGEVLIGTAGGDLKVRKLFVDGSEVPLRNRSHPAWARLERIQRQRSQVDRVRNAAYREPWDSGEIVGQKAPFTLSGIWALRGDPRIRCASPPESVGDGWPNVRYPRPTSFGNCSGCETLGTEAKKSIASSTEEADRRHGSCRRLQQTDQRRKKAQLAP